jgi:hypothetical protein
MVFLLLQPLSLVAGLYYYSGALYKELWEKLVLLVIGLISLIKGLAAAIYAFFIDTERKWLSVKGPHCHLIWWFIKNINILPRIIKGDLFYILPLFLALVMIKPLNIGLLYGGLGALSYHLTRLFYGNEYGSFWCWLSISLSIIVILIPYLA